MKYHIKEWPDHTASLIVEGGYALDTFENVLAAVDACYFDCIAEPEYIESHVNDLDPSPLDFESSFLSESTL